MKGVTARLIRRSYPIAGYTGPNGSGKTLAMVYDTLPTLAKGRRVLSTVRLLDWQNPRLCDDEGCRAANHSTHLAAHPCYVPWVDWAQLLEAEHCDVLADEITGIASSREHMGLPAAVANSLVQLRRRDVTFRWSAPAWARADLLIRECSQSVTVCRGLFAETKKDDQERLWRPRRLARWVTFDAQARTQMSDGTFKDAKPFAAAWHWIPKSEAIHAYDTYDAVSMIGQVSDSGRCSSCGGRRSVPECGCEDYQARKASGKRKLELGVFEPNV